MSQVPLSYSIFANELERPPYSHGALKLINIFPLGTSSEKNGIMWEKFPSE